MSRFKKSFAIRKTFDKRMALDLFDFVKSNKLTEQKVCNWFE